ncbi:hypothetical protein FPV67DRAFT_1016960 [Lyophyllum atratum]|nr:hypothetical protein FPV67DRAFT_1016960 [Lyophyllum atratum]
MFPLPLFPTVAVDLEGMDSRSSVQHMNTFMKNTLIRGVNNIYQTAPHVNNKSLVDPFLRYAIIVCDMLSLHLQGDQMFFTKGNAQNKSLVDFLGITAPYATESSALQNILKHMLEKLHSWTKTPGAYSYVDLQLSLKVLGTPMLQSMASQRNALNKDSLMKFVAEAELRDMITDNLIWLASHSDMSLLLPFVLSHHDPATSEHWPNVAPEGLGLVPDFVHKDLACWGFAPIDPITRQKRSNSSTLGNNLTLPERLTRL